MVFVRLIGQDQGVQRPLATEYMALEAAKLAIYHAAGLYDSSGKVTTITTQAVGTACNSANYLAAEAASTTSERAVSEEISFSKLAQRRCKVVLAHGGMDYDQEYHVERYPRDMIGAHDCAC